MIVDHEGVELQMPQETPSGIDWRALRELSLKPGGFGDDRVHIWPKLLHVELPSTTHNSSTPPEDTAPHSDEHQIGLDTDRSFVLYPVEDVGKDRETLQAELHELLLAIFRRRPRLSYFQGYHDIITVLFLTLPPDLQLPCAEQLSLQRVRDSMGSGLEPILGLLRIMQRILRLADPAYAELLEGSSPLPYFALSNLLTLFSHDMPTLPLIQHVFDYLLCRPPIMAVYLAAAITLSRKQEVLRLEEEGEDGMIHSLLSGMPNLTDGEDNPVVKVETPDDEMPLGGVPDGVKPEIILVNSNVPALATTSSSDELAALEAELKLEQESMTPLSPLDKSEDSSADLTTSSASPSGSSTAVATSATFGPDADTPSQSESSLFGGVSLDPNSLSKPAEDDPESSTSQSRPPSPGSSNANPSVSPSAYITAPPPSPPPAQNHPLVSLSSLLERSDALFEEHAPSHPSLALSSVMGPQSVIFTWSTSPSDMPNKDAAERMVAHPELVVYPYVEETFKTEESDVSKENDPSSSRRKPKRSKARRKLRRALEMSDKKTMVVGAVLVLGVAMAVYGVRSGMTGEGRHGHTISREWKKFGGWVGGALVGVGERVWNLAGEKG